MKKMLLVIVCLSIGISLIGCKENKTTESSGLETTTGLSAIESTGTAICPTETEEIREPEDTVTPAQTEPVEETEATDATTPQKNDESTNPTESVEPTQNTEQATQPPQSDENETERD